MVRKRKVYYCEQCGKWRGTNKKCPECENETIARELPKARGDCYFLPGIPQPLPRVTSILKVLAKPGLTYWKAKTAAEAALADPTLSVSEAIATTYKKRDKAGAEGFDVHRIIRSISKGEAVDKQALSKIAQVRAYGKFCEAVAHRTLESELIVYSEKLGFAGTLDAVIQTFSTAIVEGEKRVVQAKKAGYEIVKEVGPLSVMRRYNRVWLVDFKTNNNIYPEHFLQLSAYRHALEEMKPKLKIDGLAIVHLKKDATFALVEGTDCFPVFLAALKIYNWMNGSNK